MFKDKFGIKEELVRFIFLVISFGCVILEMGVKCKNLII